MTNGKLPQSASKFVADTLKDALGNTLEFSDEVIGGQFVQRQGRDTGGIEPDAYTGSLLINWREAVRTMGLPADDATFLRYEHIRYWRLFEFRKDNFGNTVISEKRIPHDLHLKKILTL